MYISHPLARQGPQTQAKIYITTIVWFPSQFMDIWYFMVLHSIAWQYMVLQRFYLFFCLGRKYERLKVRKAGSRKSQKQKKLEVKIQKQGSSKREELEVGKLEVGGAGSRKSQKWESQMQEKLEVGKLEVGKVRNRRIRSRKAGSRGAIITEMKSKAIFRYLFKSYL